MTDAQDFRTFDFLFRQVDSIAAAAVVGRRQAKQLVERMLASVPGSTSTSIAVSSSTGAALQMQERSAGAALQTQERRVEKAPSEPEGKGGEIVALARQTVRGPAASCRLCPVPTTPHTPLSKPLSKKVSATASVLCCSHSCPGALLFIQSARSDQPRAWLSKARCSCHVCNSSFWVDAGCDGCSYPRCRCDAAFAALYRCDACEFASCIKCYFAAASQSIRLLDSRGLTCVDDAGVLQVGQNVHLVSHASEGENLSVVVKARVPLVDLQSAGVTRYECLALPAGSTTEKKATEKQMTLTVHPDGRILG